MKNNLEDFIQISQKLKKACQVKDTEWKLECIFIIQLSFVLIVKSLTQDDEKCLCE